MSGTDYIELRARSAFSFLEGSVFPEDLAERAAELGYPALALGDRDGLYGMPRFHHAAKHAGIRAIVGAELTLADRSRLYVLVPDRERYKNLCRMVTAAKLRPVGPGKARRTGASAPQAYPEKGKSHVTLEDLERFGKGLVCLAGGALSPLSRLLVRGEDPRPLLDRIRSAFGPENVFIDLQRHLDPGEERNNRRLLALAEATGTAVVAANDVCHDGAARDLLDVLTCIRLHKTLEEAGRALWINNERYLKPPAEMASLFRDLPRAVRASRAIAERCAFTLEDLGYRFPDYPLPPGESADSYLRALTMAGARERWSFPLEERVRRQLDHELSIIAKLKLAGYFLIVWDIVQFCRENRIMAQGRGSAANSAVCYALGITAVDAVRMELLFERFLSVERGEWPDIDLDLPSGEQREQVIQYVYRRYGERGAAMTANVITYRTRSAVREIAKVLGFAPDRIDRMARVSQPYEFGGHRDDLAELLERGGFNPRAPGIARLVDLVGRIRGLPRHLGQHSGGMVIAAGPLDELVPLEPATMPGRVVVQWDKEDCADLGIIKIDLLGLGMLAVLEETLAMVREHEGVALDLARLPDGDPKVYAMLQRADTVGVFQVESRAQMATLPRMKPRSFYDLVVEVAIIRPGPIVGQMVHPYLERRAGRAPVRYPHPALEPILRRTLGVPLFQEQLLRMAMAVAGFSAGEAEELRRAMGFRRSTARMEAIERKLRDGMARSGVAPEAAGEVVRSIASFALYGFPESHAASFALIAYASAYLKCHHPAAFFAAVLNCYPLGFYAPATLVKDAQRHGVEVRPAGVTRSNRRCTLEKTVLRGGLAIRLGLNYIGGLRSELGDRIEAQRAIRPFESIADFAARTAPSRREIDALAYAGAFAAFGSDRRDALWQAAAVERDGQSLLAGVGPIRSGPADAPATAAERNGAHQPLTPMTQFEETAADLAITGLTTGPHPMAYLRASLRARGFLSAADLASAKDRQTVKTAGIVIVRQRPGTAKGMLFLTLEDETGLSNAIVTPGLFDRNRALLHRAPVLAIEGVLQKRDGVVAIRAQHCAALRLDAPTPPSHDFA